ncbi:hypothetical protein ARALYDRAFT_349109 [Arabidopsis lyrata subsp. lyrata]|uniref:DUF247 domain-containing protein n=1 Tax=Arabidopsis lyrata subsp. lyrata TaxID=81972 RepID=D7LRQ8_ARALL|nr:hypothetical protein ARALYDRAFT_349109 [Arabidopsis lyrata subsp. lyrata]
MAFLKLPLLREPLGSEDKIGCDDPEIIDGMLDLELGTTQKLNKQAPGMWLFPKNQKHCCIYRVPNSIRRVKPEAYTPQLLILGPLHHSSKSQALKSLGDITDTKSMGYLNMEEHKKIYLAEFARRVEGEKTIDGFRRIIEEDEEMIRASYSESTAWIESAIFVDMILHDSVFVLEFILRSSYEVKEDLILLENQLPYFILEKLFDPIVPTLTPHQTFRELVITHFDCQGKIGDNSKFRHFTDLVRLVRVETLPRLARGKYNPIEHMYNADKLDRGGVEFEAVDEEFSLSVRFEKGCLKMHCLRVDDEVEMKLRNVMALEQCHYPFNAHVCNYVIFLDYLIDTHKDVDLLVEKGIIKNWIGQHGLVAEMVNKLCLGILEVGSYYSDIAVEVNRHYSNPVNRSCAVLKRVYFGDMWTGTASVTATLLLLMTLTQTVTSIIQVLQK